MRTTTGAASGEAATHGPLPPHALVDQPAADLRPLGEALCARAEEVLAQTVAQTVDADEPIDAVVQESFERICTGSTVAVARWIAGDPIEVTLDSSRETSQIFGELAAHRAAALGDVTRRCFCWRNVMAENIEDCAGELGTSEASLAQALNMLQLSLEFNFLRVCECFDAERMRRDEELHRREEELAFLATHDPLTGLPNRTLILDRVQRMLDRSVRSQTPVAALFIDLDNFKTSTTRSATGPATNCCAPSRRAWKASCARPTGSAASAATSSS